jgi:hypothetical protein
MCNNLQFFYNLYIYIHVTIPIDNQVRYKKRQMTEEEEEKKADMDNEENFHQAVIQPPANGFKYQESTSSVRITPSGSSYGSPPKISKYKESNSFARITPSASSTSVPYDTTPLLKSESDPYQLFFLLLSPSFVFFYIEPGCVCVNINYKKIVNYYT